MTLDVRGWANWAALTSARAQANRTSVAHYGYFSALSARSTTWRFRDAGGRWHTVDTRDFGTPLVANAPITLTRRAGGHSYHLTVSYFRFAQTLVGPPSIPFLDAGALCYATFFIVTDDPSPSIGRFYVTLALARNAGLLTPTSDYQGSGVQRFQLERSGSWINYTTPRNLRTGARSTLRKYALFRNVGRNSGNEAGSYGDTAFAATDRPVFALQVSGLPSGFTRRYPSSFVTNPDVDRLSSAFEGVPLPPRTRLRATGEVTARARFTNASPTITATATATATASASFTNVGARTRLRATAVAGAIARFTNSSPSVSLTGIAVATAVARFTRPGRRLLATGIARATARFTGGQPTLRTRATVSARARFTNEAPHPVVPREPRALERWIRLHAFTSGSGGHPGDGGGSTTPSELTAFPFQSGVWDVPSTRLTTAGGSYVSSVYSFDTAVQNFRQTGDDIEVIATGRAKLQFNSSGGNSADVKLEVIHPTGTSVYADTEQDVREGTPSEYVRFTTRYTPGTNVTGFRLRWTAVTQVSGNPVEVDDVTYYVVRKDSGESSDDDDVVLASGTATAISIGAAPPNTVADRRPGQTPRGTWSGDTGDPNKRPYQLHLESTNGTLTAVMTGRAATYATDRLHIGNRSVAFSVAQSTDTTITTGVTGSQFEFTGDYSGWLVVGANDWSITSAPSGGASDYLALTDTPSSYTGQSGKVPVVPATEDSLPFGDMTPALVKVDDTPFTNSLDDAGQTLEEVLSRIDGFLLPTAGSIPSTSFGRTIAELTLPTASQTAGSVIAVNWTRSAEAPSWATVSTTSVLFDMSAIDPHATGFWLEVDTGATELTKQAIDLNVLDTTEASDNPYFKISLNSTQSLRAVLDSSGGADIQLRLFGDGTTFPANTTVRVVERVQGGSGIDVVTSLPNVNDLAPNSPFFLTRQDGIHVPGLYMAAVDPDSTAPRNDFNMPSWPAIASGFSGYIASGVTGIVAPPRVSGGIGNDEGLVPAVVTNYRTHTRVWNTRIYYRSYGSTEVFREGLANPISTGRVWVKRPDGSIRVIDSQTHSGAGFAAGVMMGYWAFTAPTFPATGTYSLWTDAAATVPFNFKVGTLAPRLIAPMATPSSTVVPGRVKYTSTSTDLPDVADYAEGDLAVNINGIFMKRPATGMTNTVSLAGYTPARLVDVYGYDRRTAAAQPFGGAPVGVPQSQIPSMLVDGDGLFEVNTENYDMGAGELHQSGEVYHASFQANTPNGGRQYFVANTDLQWSTAALPAGTTFHVLKGMPFTSTAEHWALLISFNDQHYTPTEHQQDVFDAFAVRIWQDVGSVPADDPFVYIQPTTISASGITARSWTASSAPTTGASNQFVGVRVPGALLNSLKDYRLQVGDTVYPALSTLQPIIATGGFTYLQYTGVNIAAGESVRMTHGLPIKIDSVHTLPDQAGHDGLFLGSENGVAVWKSVRAPTITELPVPLVPRNQYYLIQPDTIDQSKSAVVLQAQPTLRTATSLTPNFNGVRGFSPTYNGISASTLRNRVVVSFHSTLTSPPSKLMWGTALGRQAEYAVSSTIVPGLQHTYLVTGLSYDDMVRGSTFWFNVQFQDGSWLFPPTQVTAGFWTALTAQSLIGTPGSAADWAQIGDDSTMPPSKLPYQVAVWAREDNDDPIPPGKTSAAGVRTVARNLAFNSLRITSSSATVYEAPISPTPVFDMDDNDKSAGVFEVSAVLDLSARSNNTIAWQAVANQDEASDALRATLSDIAFVSDILAATAYDSSQPTAVAGRLIGTASVYQGPSVLGILSFYAVRSSTNQLGFSATYRGGAGSATFNIGISVSCVFQPTDAGPAPDTGRVYATAQDTRPYTARDYTGSAIPSVERVAGQAVHLKIPSGQFNGTRLLGIWVPDTHPIDFIAVEGDTNDIGDFTPTALTVDGQAGRQWVSKSGIATNTSVELWKVI